MSTRVNKGTSVKMELAQIELPKEQCKDFLNGEYGSLKNAKKILTAHREIAEKYKTASSYWLFADKSQSEKPHLFEHFARGPFIVKIGSIQAFSAEALAVIVDSTTKSYIEHNTFEDFPVEDALEIERLEAVMINGFNERHLVVSLRDREEDLIIGGCMVVLGQSEKPISDLAGSYEAALPTLFSLNFSYDGFLEIGKTREDRAVCYTRFYRLPDRLLPVNSKDNDYLRRFSIETLTGMARAVKNAAEFWNLDLEVGILDTHDPNVVKTLSRHYGANILSEQATPAKLVQAPNPLHYHYDIPGIQVLYFDNDKQISIADRLDIKLGEKNYYEH